MGNLDEIIIYTLRITFFLFFGNFMDSNATWIFPLIEESWLLISLPQEVKYVSNEKGGNKIKVADLLRVQYLNLSAIVD